MQTGILVISPNANHVKNDAVGAFIPEAKAFARFHGYDPNAVVKHFSPHGSYAARRASCDAHLRALRVEIHTLAFVCHGFRRGIQAGYQLGQIADLVSLLKGRLSPAGRVILYACDTARDSDEDTKDDRLPGPGGDGGFADALRDRAEAEGMPITVYAHTTAGHATQNPYVRVFEPGGGGAGGHWLIDPGEPVFRQWGRALRDPSNTLRYRFPYLTSEDIRRELTQPALG